MSSGIRTDLALESRELNPDIEGVEEQTEERERMTVSRIKITDRTAAEKLDKPIGKYVTLDAPELCNRPLDLFEQMSAALSEELRDMFTGLKDCEGKELFEHDVIKNYPFIPSEIVWSEELSGYYLTHANGKIYEKPLGYYLSLGKFIVVGNKFDKEK